MKRIILSLVLVAFGFYNNLNAQIFQWDKYSIMSDKEDIQMILKEYKNKNNSCEGLKPTMRHRCEYSKIMLLKKYQKEIIAYYDSTYFEYSDYYFLSFFDVLPQEIIETGMRQKEIPEIFKAKHGKDTAAYSLLLSRATNYFIDTPSKKIPETVEHSWPDYIMYLLLLHTEESMDIFYKILASDKYGVSWTDGRQTYQISIAWVAIQTYLALYPPSVPVSKINRRIFEVTSRNSIEIEDIDRAKFNQYVADVKRYISTREKHKVEINTQYFELGDYTIEEY